MLAAIHHNRQTQHSQNALAECCASVNAPVPGTQRPGPDAEVPHRHDRAAVKTTVSAALSDGSSVERFVSLGLARTRLVTVQQSALSARKP